jgi:integrase/recombinase XerD
MISAALPLKGIIALLRPLSKHKGGIAMKEQLINDVLLRMQEVINREQLRVLEQVLLAVMYSVDVVRMETALSTELDDNQYMLDTIKLNMQKRDLSSKTIEQYMRAARMFLDTVHKNLRNVVPIDIEYYLNEFARGKLKVNSPQSVNNERQFLSSVFTWLRRCNFITANPVENVAKKKVPRKPIDFLQGIEVEELRTACDQDTIKGKRERAVLEFLLSTGARVGEVPEVKITDIDFVSGSLMIYGHKDREYREVYLNDAARLHVKRYLDARQDDSPYLFVSLKKPALPIHESAYRDLLQDIKAKAELRRRVYPHLMRKTMASSLRQHGASLDDIADILGHANIKVTRDYYAAQAPGQLRHVHKSCIA